MRSAAAKDILRTVRKSRKRFFAIMIITILGVAMFSGLKASCVDLRLSADSFFDEQNLHDIQIVSTLGLTQADVDALRSLELAEEAEGIFAETVNARIGEKDFSLTAQTIPAHGMDSLYVLEGETPQKPSQCAVTQQFLDESGLSVGDILTIKETLDQGDENTDPEKPNFRWTIFKITAVVIDPTDVNNPSGATSFRTSTIADRTIFVLPKAVETDIFTSVLVRLKGAEELFCFDKDYLNLVARFKEIVESEIKEQRENARYDQIRTDALHEIEKVEQEVTDQLAEALKQLQDGEEEMKKQLADASNQLYAAEENITSGWEQYDKGLEELNTQEASARQQLADARATLDSVGGTFSGILGSAYGEKEAAQSLLGDAWPEAEWQSAVAANRAGIDPALRNVMSEIDMSSLNFSEEPTEEEINALLAQVSAMTENMSTEDWVAVAQYAGAGAAASNQLQAAYTAAAVERQLQLQLEIEEIRASAFTGNADGYVVQQSMAAATTDETNVEESGDVEEPENPGESVPPNEPENSDEPALPEEPDLPADPEPVEPTIPVIYELTEEQQARIEANQAEILALQQYSESIGYIAAEYAAAESVTGIMGEAKAEIDAQEALLNRELASARQKLAEARDQLISGEARLEEGWESYNDGKAEGEQKLADGYAEYQAGAADASEQFADARRRIEELDVATWYLQDRTALSGYNNIGSDADSIEAIGTVFPVVFFVVAILISLTTVTRMVEEDRGLIGTYKALGFTDREIRRKYVWYAAGASASGAAVGSVFAFLILPMFICWIFTIMYLLPQYHYTFVPFHGITGPLLFIGGITCATIITCRTELRQMPAALMRPKAPKSGSRIFLEYIPFIWNRMGFLNKVTARNLFRYKKRLFMTISGIAGCMALLLFGFAIKDSVQDLMPRQYEQTSTYDLLAVVQASDNEKLLSYMEDENIADTVNLEVTSVTLKLGEDSLSVQLMVFPYGESIERYTELRDVHGASLRLNDGEVYITQNAGNVLGFSGGDIVTMRLIDLQQAEIPVTALVQNYLSNYIYMTRATFEQYYELYEPNAVLAHFSDRCSDTKAFKNNLSEKSGILTCLETQELRDQFSGAFLLINMVVYVVIIMSAALAFVVLFTLSTTNISERERELATIKVLGFFDKEVHLYVDKETVILTCIGIILGVPLGYAFSQTLTAILNLPSIYLAVSLHPVSYAISGGLSLLFTLVVNTITDRSLDKINPVEALKSVE